MEVQVLSSAPYCRPRTPFESLRFFIAALLLSSPALSFAAQESMQANPKRWLLIFPLLVIILTIALIKLTRHK